MVVRQLRDSIGLHGAMSRIDDDAAFDGIGRALDSVRKHLGMDVGFVSEFTGDERIFHHVSSAWEGAPIQVGQRLSLDRGYCKKIVDGEIPSVIPDTRAYPALQQIAETRLLPIGSHLSVPIRLADGTVYGTICCFSSEPVPTLNDRDLNTLKLVADLVSSQIETHVLETRRKAETLGLIQAAIVAAEPNMVYQPVYELASRTVVGAEALSRFSNAPYRTPDRWFADAGVVGLRSELEIAAIRNAVAGYASIWKDAPTMHLAVNASAATINEHDFLGVLRGAPLDRVLIEITEHDKVEDYGHLDKSLAPLREKGVRIAVDDAGSGYASLRHILRIRPDVIKLDISLTRDIDKDPMRHALATAVVQFSSQTSSLVLAEGIETEAELSTMTKLGVRLGQGFLLGKPAPVETMRPGPKRATRVRRPL